MQASDKTEALQQGRADALTRWNCPSQPGQAETLRLPKTIPPTARASLPDRDTDESRSDGEPWLECEHLGGDLGPALTAKLAEPARSSAVAGAAEITEIGSPTAYLLRSPQSEAPDLRLRRIAAAADTKGPREEVPVSAERRSPRQRLDWRREVDRAKCAARAAANACSHSRATCLAYQVELVRARVQGRARQVGRSVPREDTSRTTAAPAT
jgi:hypothetical protein